MIICNMSTGEVKEVVYKGKIYYFEFNRMLGYMCCDEEGNGMDCPNEVWDKLQKGLDEEKEDE